MDRTRMSPVAGAHDPLEPALREMHVAIALVAGLAMSVTLACLDSVEGVASETPS